MPKQYTEIYFIFASNIIAVAELFIFWGLNDVVVRAVTEPSIMMGIKSDFMIAVGLITVVTILLMVFSMRYYIKLRAKDYGTFYYAWDEKEDVLFALDAIATPLSLYEPVYQDGGDTLYLMDQVKDKKQRR